MDESYDREVVEAVRRFVDRDVIPVANELEHNDEYPHALVHSPGQIREPVADCNADRRRYEHHREHGEELVELQRDEASLAQEPGPWCSV